MSVHYPPIDAPEPAATSLPLPLLDGEEVIREIRPNAKRVSRYLGYVANGIGFLAFSVWAPALLVGPLAEHGYVADPLLGVLLYVGGILTAQVLFWLVATPFVLRASGSYRYWVTNRRVVTRSGAIGYALSSVPLEGIAEVTVVGGGLCALTGTPVLVIRDKAANPQKRATRWYGVEEPEEVQHAILQAMDRDRSKARV